MEIKRQQRSRLGRGRDRYCEVCNKFIALGEYYYQYIIPKSVRGFAEGSDRNRRVFRCEVHKPRPSEFTTVPRTKEVLEVWEVLYNLTFNTTYSAPAVSAVILVSIRRLRKAEEAYHSGGKSRTPKTRLISNEFIRRVGAFREQLEKIISFDKEAKLMIFELEQVVGDYQRFNRYDIIKGLMSDGSWL